MIKCKIEKCFAREILDSRGIPTVEATVVLQDGTIGIASVPSGASTGSFEAHEKRDGNRVRYMGKGVSECVTAAKEVFSPLLSGKDPTRQREIDALLRETDGTSDKSTFGANLILALSMAVARASANAYHLPLYRYIGGNAADRLPIPMMNILNGGAHASNNVEIQEFMIVPVGASSFSEAMQMGSEIYHTLKKLLISNGYGTAVGDEGGFAPSLGSDEEALDLLVDAINTAGYDTRTVRLALDAAASEWHLENGIYRLPKRGSEKTREDLLAYWKRLASLYPLLSIEDGLDEEDFEGWRNLTEAIGKTTMLVGDDLFVTSTDRIRKGISLGAANAVLVKPNQIGTLTETLDLIHLAREHGYRHILSHRSGETEDTSISDLAIATGAAFIKAGAPCRSERVAKYNRLLRIEASLGGHSRFGVDSLRSAEAAHEEVRMQT